MILWIASVTAIKSGGTTMIKQTLLAGTAILLFATSAYASHCPKDAAAIDHALGALEVSDDVKTQVTALRDKGMAEHEAGNHADAENSLSEAMRLLLMSVE